ncbi:zinc finger, CCHC-type containing protein [Tanacetum coccineum]|uniref:Zinc finger, CCHC-type containing protein n=1 Tax=Tanacetum coccineum TaxID=301880 RepID=A0ABQ4ZFK7_9ASTR
MKWENDDYICRGHILNGMSDSLLISIKSGNYKSIWESLEITQYMAEDVSARSSRERMKLLGGVDWRNKSCLQGSSYCYVYLLHAKYEALDKFKIYKQEVELQRQDLIKVLRTDRGGEYYDPVYFQSTGIIHQTTAPYTPQQNGVAERKNRTLRNGEFPVIHSGISEGFWGAVVRLTEPKMKNLGKKGIDCIFIGYAEHSTCYRFYVIEPNDYVSVNSIIESRDAMFDEERFTSIPRPRGMIQPSSSKIVEDEVEAIGCLMYAMISTRPDIAFAVGKLSMYNPSALHWQALGRVFQYLKGTKDYGLTYSGYPSVIEGYSDASWINNMEDHSSTSGWVFLLGGGAISWASKKQTCITISTMESEFVALAAAGNEAECFSG